jgi:hypothetical protein
MGSPERQGGGEGGRALLRKRMNAEKVPISRKADFTG